MQDSRPLLLATDFPGARRGELEVLQVNLGYRCNLSCVHCHVNAGPHRSEMMSAETVQQVLALLRSQSVKVLDLTGGAPEMNPHFRYLVAEARALGVEVIDRCNLTILLQPGYEDLPDFLARHQVAITASLPCYLEENVEQQRGKGVYTESIEALRRLNQLGYGRDPRLPLNLVYNPLGPSLPPPQQVLEQDYKRELKARFDIDFNQLFALTNMPVSRFGSVLMSRGELQNYLQLLKDNFCAANLDTVMCCTLLSVDWQGYLYDCDFNQMLNLPLRLGDRPRSHISQLPDARLEGNPVAVADHCYGCTAGQGSSCGGALEESSDRDAPGKPPCC